MSTHLRHILKTIQCRMDGVLADVPTDFGTFSIGEGPRRPAEILSHMADVLSFTVEKVAPSQFGWTPGPNTWDEHASRYQSALHCLDVVLTEIELSDDVTERLVQGPLSDVLTHVGQLAMLRGLAGAAVPPQMFFALNLENVRPTI